jgi:hypothetical protein
MPVRVKNKKKITESLSHLTIKGPRNFKKMFFSSEMVNFEYYFCFEGPKVIINLWEDAHTQIKYSHSSVIQ